MTTPSFARDRDLCHNFLGILISLDRHVLVEAGVLDFDDGVGWARFRDDPFRAFSAVGGERRDRLFTLVQERLYPRLRAADWAPA